MDERGISFEFVDVGVNAAGVGPGMGRLYLDVGNSLEPGVVDHHHLAAYSGSATGLVLQHPELVTEAVGPEGCLTIVLHRKPDLDSLCAAFLAVSLVKDGRFPEGAEALAAYVDQVDAGYSGMTPDRPFTLYSAYMVLKNRLGQRVWSDERDEWHRCVRQGLEVVSHVVAQMGKHDASIFEIDAFACPGLFGPRDRDDVTQDLERYRRKLSEPLTCARIARVLLPRQREGAEEVPALLVRNVQSDADRDRCLFFKDWARTDRARSGNGPGFVATAVYEDETGTSRRRCIVSVTPASKLSLRGLGEKLEAAESAKRELIHGIDDRTVDAAGQPLEPRVGYANPDPWYDGRSHDYTIVDAPREGTILTADELERIFLRFGRGGQTLEPPRLTPAELRESPGLDEAKVRQFSLLVSEWQQEHPEDRASEAPAVFISYPHTKKAEVENHIYRPLADLLGADGVFFDERTLETGVGWLAGLSEGAKTCRVFLPVYCADYFRSDFCQFELQLAVVRDPTGRKGVLTPFAVEELEVPSYCSLIQYELLPWERLASRVREVLAARLRPAP